MSLKRIRKWVFLGLSLLGGAECLHAQHFPRIAAEDALPFHPADISHNHNYRPFEAANLSDYGTGHKDNEGFFFAYNRVVWAFDSAKTTDIGDPLSQSVTFIGINPLINQNDLDTSFMQTEFVWGNRFELGYVNNDTGWLVSTSHVHNHTQQKTARQVGIAFFDPLGTLTNFSDFDGDGIQDDLNGNGIFGANAPFNFDQGTPTGGAPPFIAPPDGILDTFVGADLGDVTLNPVAFGTVTVNNRSRWNSVELMHINRWDPLHSGATVEWLLGVRYAQFSDQFTLTGRNALPGAVFDEMNMNMNINNHLVGPQFGLRWNRQRGRWAVNLEGRGMLAANFQQARLEGDFIKFATNTTPAGYPYAYNDRQTTETFAPLGEFRFDTSFQITKAVSFQMGYTAIIVGGIGRASRRIDYTITNMQVLDRNEREKLFINGFNFGFEINR